MHNVQFNLRLYIYLWNVKIHAGSQVSFSTNVIYIIEISTFFLCDVKNNYMRDTHA